MFRAWDSGSISPTRGAHTMGFLRVARELLCMGSTAMSRSRRVGEGAHPKERLMLPTRFGRKAGLAAAALGLFTLGTTTLDARPAHAQGDASFYVIADRPVTREYQPEAGINWTEFATPRVTRTRRGDYQVRFLGAGMAGGNVQVTALGLNNRYCKVRNWYKVGHDQVIRVRCFNRLGGRADSAFNVNFVEGGAKRGYVWANNARATLYTPSRSYQHNGTGRTNTVQRTGRGAYTVSFPGLLRSSGNVIVTAYGSGSERCKVKNWGGSKVKVLCHDRNGNPADTQFSVVTEEKPAGFVGYFAWASNATASSYTPSTSYQYNTFGDRITARRVSRGSYRITMPDRILQGAPIVTAYGSNASHCKLGRVRELGSWPEWSIESDVRCFDASGSLVDTRFTIKHRLY